MARICQITGKGPMVGNNVAMLTIKQKDAFYLILEQFV